MDRLQMDYLAYGLRIRSSIALPLRTAPSSDEGRSADVGARKTCVGARNRTDPDVTVRIGAMPARLPNPLGKRRRWEAAPGAFLATVDGEARYLVTDGRDIVVEPLGGSEREMGASLVGPPLAALLQQRGLTTLHAGAVEAGIGAVLFTGLVGAGKSSLLGALVERGYALLSDDVTGIVATADGRFVALPASTCVRLPADSLEALGRRPQTLEKVHEKSEKHLMPAARLCTEPTAVRAVYVLGTHHRHRPDINDIRPESWIRAHDALLRHTYRKRHLFGLGRQEEHFRTIREMATRVPVFRVRRPASPFRLQALAESIAAHIESDAGSYPPPTPPEDATDTSLAQSLSQAGTPKTVMVSRYHLTAGGLHGRGGLSEQVEATLRRKLAADPDDARALLRLADLHRGEGRLDAALDACRRVAELRPAFEPGLRRLVEDTLPRLGMAGLGEYRMELQVRTYQAGEFYTAHTDFNEAEPAPRLINYVYYLHRQPKSFTGGDLLLHDGEVANTFTRIEPLDNSIILFLSRIPHEVTLVECDPGDFGAGRFSVNGALRKSRADE